MNGTVAPTDKDVIKAQAVPDASLLVESFTIFASKDLVPTAYRLAERTAFGTNVAAAHTDRSGGTSGSSTDRKT
jgi:hypothetical protein